MSSENSKVAAESGGKKLWIFWVFGLGFFAGFLVALVVADRLKTSAGSKSQITQEPAAVTMPAEPPPPAHLPIAQEEGVRAPETHLSEKVHEVTMTKAMRQRLLTFDFLKLLQDAEIRRYRHEGETRGIVINKIRTGSIYEKMGFKDGDIVEQVNGIALADLDRRKAEMTEKLPGADELEFKIRRDDKSQRIRVKIAGPAE